MTVDRRLVLFLFFTGIFVPGEHQFKTQADTKGAVHQCEVIKDF